MYAVSAVVAPQPTPTPHPARPPNAPTASTSPDEVKKSFNQGAALNEMDGPPTPQTLQPSQHAESAVKAVKHLVLKVAPSGKLGEEFDRGLLELRNTPRRDGRSPAQVLYGRPLRSLVPAHSTSFASKWQERVEDCERRAAARAQGVKKQYDAHAKPLPPLQLGAHVRVQDPVSKRWDTVAIVMGKGRSRDYLIRSMSGRVLWRNRRFLREIPSPTTESADEEQLEVKPPKPQVTPSTRQRNRPHTRPAGPPRRSAHIALRS